MNRKLRILRIWIFGKLPLANRVRKIIIARKFDSMIPVMNEYQLTQLKIVQIKRNNPLWEKGNQVNELELILKNHETELAQLIGNQSI